MKCVWENEADTSCHACISSGRECQVGSGSVYRLVRLLLLRIIRSSDDLLYQKLLWDFKNEAFQYSSCPAAFNSTITRSKHWLTTNNSGDVCEAHWKLVSHARLGQLAYASIGLRIDSDAYHQEAMAMLRKTVQQEATLKIDEVLIHSSVLLI